MPLEGVNTFTKFFLTFFSTPSESIAYLRGENKKRISKVLMARMRIGSVNYRVLLEI